MGYKVDGDTDAMLQRLYMLHAAFDEINGTTGNINISDSHHQNRNHTILGAFESIARSDYGGIVSDDKSSSLPTLRDISFTQAYGRDIRNARRWLDNYADTKALPSLHQAWEIYHGIFRRITKQLKSIKRLELGHVTRDLRWAGGTTSPTELSLAIPGTYKPFKDTIRIQRIASTVEVIASKQRPRRMTIVGSDGKNYRFLLKGHEDLRQDERVMQLFGLINVCLSSDKSSQASGLNIVRYSVLPLSNASGLIGWVDNCDTLSQLIRQYRESRGIPLNVEQSLLDRRAPDYKKLPLLAKIECFTQVLHDTSGADIAKMLWLKSRTAEAWIERRTNYTRSIAVMSMVGYILGLGDRHLANLMLDRVSGRIVHIDFGDCFEVSLHRQKYPETVPFRLTRMIINTMEASGTEVTFRSSCEKVMRVLRRNGDSVMAMLEVFVYDPLISWKLLSTQIAQAQANTQSQNQSTINPDTQTTITSVHTAANVDKMALDSDTDETSAILAGVEKVLTDAHAHSASLNLPGMPPLSTSSGRESLRDKILTGMGVGDQSQGSSSTTIAGYGADENEPLEDLNARALEVINRIQAKLTGRDFEGYRYGLRYKHSIEKAGVIQTATVDYNTISLSEFTTNIGNTINRSQIGTSAAYLQHSSNDTSTTMNGVTLPTSSGSSSCRNSILLSTQTVNSEESLRSKEGTVELSVEAQVEMLVSQATSIENLC